MSPSDASPGRRVLRMWELLRPVPAGRWLFSKALGWMVPYSGTVSPRVRCLAPGTCVAEIRDRRGVRNHLDSVHAVALANLGELVTGLSTLTALPPRVRGIAVELSVAYEKKARGRIRARCRTEVPPVDEQREHVARGQLVDRDGDVVARVEATWRLSPPAEEDDGA